MTHLRIEQNNGTIEEVSSAVIDKLYDIVSSGNLDQNSNLIGRLHTTATYQDYIDYLEDAFKVNGTKLLIIDATKKYISFTDPEVASYWANSTYGDGTGIDSTSAASVLLIPAAAFKDNTSILSFDELNKFSNCNTIKYNAFWGCSSLTSIDLSNITKLEGSSFRQCGSLASTNNGILNIPNVTTIEGNDVFITNTSLVELNIGSQVLNSNRITSLGNTVFCFCSSLEKVTGLNMVTNIGTSCFRECTNLESLDFTSNLTTIGALCFCYCTNLKCIDLSGVSSFSNDGNLAFLGCNSLIDLSTSDPTLVNNGAATYTFNWSTVPGEIFNGCKLTNKSFIFPNATSIYSKAFYNTKITSISLPNVETIGQYAFYNCTSLNSSISLPNCTSIANDAFRLSGITSFSAPNLTSIGGGCFNGCTSLQSVTFPSNMSSFGNYMFNDCTNLTSVLLPTNITELGNNMFSGCRSLTSITIPSSVTSLGAYCFRNTGITSIIIPSSVTEIGGDAFTNSNLASITFEPNSLLTTLGGGCFNGCKLVSIDIPDSCTTISSNAFINISTISSITIGTGILTIADAFTTSTNNYTITIKATTPPSFTKNSSRKPTAIYVPSGSVSAYLTASGWSDWADIILAIPNS